MFSLAYTLNAHVRITCMQCGNAIKKKTHTSDAERDDATHEAARTTAADDKTRQKDMRAVCRVSLT